MTRLLVVDDDDDVRDALVSVLGDEGFEVSEAADGLEALALLEEGPLPDVLLLDWMMPVMNGVELRRALLRNPRLAGLPVVFLSADARLASRARELEASAVLSKPVRLDDLVAALERARAAGVDASAPGP